jgi:opacity protein-like surface antigen
MVSVLKKWVFLSTLCLSCNTFAAIDAFILGGGTYSKLSEESTTVTLNDFVTNEYDGDSHSVWDVMGGIGVGYTFPLSPLFQLSTYLSAYVVSMGQVTGTEHPFVNAGPQFDTLDYQFKVNSYALMLESRLAVTRYALQPFVLAGIGGSWNQLFSYQEKPSNPSSSAAPIPQGFGDHGQASFAYQVGVGLQYNFLQGDVGQPTWQVSLDYRYMNFGSGSLGSIPNETTNETLSLSNIDTQALVLTLHFVL